MGIRRHGGPRGMTNERQKRSRPIKVLLRRMMGYLGDFKRAVSIGAVFSILATIVTVFDLPVLTSGIDASFSGSGSIDLVLTLALLYLGLRVLAWLFNGLYTWILSGAQAGFIQTIQKDVYAHLVKADLSYHKSEQSGNVTSRVTSDTVALGTGIQVLIDVSSRILLLVSTFIYLWFVSPTIAITSLVVVPGVVIIAVLFGTVGQRVMLASQRAYGRVSGQIAENLGGIHVAKAFNRERELAEEMGELNQKAYKHGFKFMILMSAMQPLIRATGSFAVAAILFVGSSLIIGTAPVLTVGQLILGISLTGRFMWPLLMLAMMATQVQASLAAMDRISDVLEAEPAITDLPGAVPLSDTSDGIIFEDVTFSYVADVPVLKNVSFEIQPGETVAIVGHTGAGKTTIASLVNRFYDPENGKIRIGTQDLRDVKLESLHYNMSLIPQEPYLFDGTIMENIRYGKPDATDEEIMELCTLIGANDFIEVLADGYNSVIIESGKNLSAGQKQMITIARTMLADPKILILDEATSRLDAYSESLVQDAQSLLFSDRTTVVIAHRLTTIANASRVFVFDHGELIEQGTHEELLALGGTFKALYDTYYAHQGIEKLTEDRARIAVEEVSKCKQPAIIPKMPDSATGSLTPEMKRKLAENPEMIPPEMRERMKKMRERQD